MLDVCEGHNCNSGTCVNEAGTPTCDCRGTGGFTGKNCEIPPEGGSSKFTGKYRTLN